MKLLIATGLYPPEIGGPATYTKLLEEDLPAHGIEVDVLSFAAVRKYPKLIRHVIYGWKVWQAAKQADVVYALDPVSVGLPALLASRFQRKRLIVRIGGDYAWEQGRVRFGITETLDQYLEHPKRATLPVRILAAIQSFVSKEAFVVIAPSQYLKSVITQWGVTADSVTVIYSTLLPLLPDQSATVTKTDLRLTGPIILTAGRLVPWKGVAALVLVIEHLVQQHPELTLVVVGDGPEQTNLAAIVAKHNLDQHVQFVGRQNKTELANLITAADIFVLNTAYEGLSHQLLEVMDLGTPIVTTSVGGNTELLTSDQDALLVEFDDIDAIAAACEKILTQPQFAERLTQAARARSKDFSRQRAVDQIASVIKNIHET